ncbi:MAG: dNTP triphosphohydrolase [Fimbriimonadaceae bacterium]|nr:dNTP triphosphohydrolase [Fimbriimonadaceae bacterium]
MRSGLITERRWPDERGSRDGHRTPFQRDVDRLIHSPYLRRLAGVTQVASALDRDYLHTRLTHTLEVSQIARRLADRYRALLGARDSDAAAALDGLADVCEAAALAHDLGHPPFGHAGEHELDRLFPGIGFEGTAQSFRIVTLLDARYARAKGTNLTYETLRGIIKYPQTRDEFNLKKFPGIRKYNAYASEGFDLLTCIGNDRTPSIAAKIMDTADEWAYAVSDYVDFVRAGMIPPLDDPLCERLAEKLTSDGVEATDVDQAFSHLRLMPPFSDSHEFQVAASEHARMTIHGYFSAVELDSSGESFGLGTAETARLKLSRILVNDFVLGSKELRRTQAGQRRVLARVVDALRSEPGLIPRRWHDVVQIASGTQDDDALYDLVVRDFVASLTEAEVFALDAQLHEGRLGSITDRALR